MSGKKAPTKHKAKAGATAKALPARKARSTVKARPTKTPPLPQLITPRDLEILEYAEAMGLFAKKQYQAAQPLFLRLTARRISTLHMPRAHVCRCVNNSVPNRELEIVATG